MCACFTRPVVYTCDGFCVGIALVFPRASLCQLPVSFGQAHLCPTLDHAPQFPIRTKSGRPQNVGASLHAMASGGMSSASTTMLCKGARTTPQFWSWANGGKRRTMSGTRQCLQTSGRSQLDQTTSHCFTAPEVCRYNPPLCDLIGMAFIGRCVWNYTFHSTAAAIGHHWRKGYSSCIIDRYAICVLNPCVESVPCQACPPPPLSHA